jgi:outer membrane protein assembly factor BamB
MKLYSCHLSDVHSSVSGIKLAYRLLSASMCSVFFLSIGQSADAAIQVSAQQPAVQQRADQQPAEQQQQASQSESQFEWSQWRGPNRDGVLAPGSLPNSISEDALKVKWKVSLGPSYSGPIVVGNKVFTTETKKRKFEVIRAFDRSSGKELWSSEWEGSMSVPFFAKSNGDWIRATPAFDSNRLYVPGIRGVLACLNAETGEEIWKVDFPGTMGSPVPTFGFVCSPLVDGDSIYIQAGGAFCKLNKETGSVIWRGVEDGGGMNGSAFSSPMIATIAGMRQAIVQTRTKLCGVDLETGKTLWSQDIPTFRGMNIITPAVYKDSLFNSSYGGTTQLINVANNGGSYSLTQKWNLPAQGYMNSPVIIDDHAYIHLRNQRFACYDLVNGVEKWRSQTFGKYSSMVASGDKILTLDQKGELLLIKANPNEFELVERRKVGDDSWAHLAVRGNQIFIRNLNELVALEWAK